MNTKENNGIVDATAANAATPIEVTGTVVAATAPEVVTTDGKRAAKKKKSLKGEWGKVGAPPKAVNWPTTPFTSALLFCRNPKQCELGLRNKIKRGIAAGTILALATKKQPGGSVGRPKSVYVLTEHFDPATMTLATTKAETPPTVVESGTDDVSVPVVQTEPVVDTQIIEPVSVVVLEVSPPVEDGGNNTEPALETVTEVSAPVAVVAEA